MFWYAVIFLSPREGKFKQKNNQLFSWLKKEGKTEASACLIGWPVGPVSANQRYRLSHILITKKNCWRLIVVAQQSTLGAHAPFSCLYFWTHQTKNF